ncbi:membrane protein [Agromyces flavus]|nr:membrane protein [Agromyces flavus]
MPPLTTTRFPRSVYGMGAEPDPRFSLANERTFLAWNRTALALIAGGVALEALGLDLQPGFRLAASLVLVAAGLAVPVLAWVEWARTERALRASAALPGSATSVLLAITVVLVAVLVLFGILWR